MGSTDGLEYYDKATERLVQINLGIHEPLFVSSIQEDEEGCLWFYCNSNKVGKYNPQTGGSEFISFSTNTKSLMNVGGRLSFDPRGYLWIGSEYEGLFVYNLKTKKSRRFSIANKKFQSDIILCLSEDRQKGMWVGTDNGGVYHFKSPEDDYPTHYLMDINNENSISSNTVYEILQIEPNLTLFGTFAGGLDIINSYRHKFASVTDRGEKGKVLSQRSVLNFYKAAHGKLWIGTDGVGLNLFDPATKTYTYYSKENKKMPHSSVAKSVFVDSKSRILSGSYAGGVAVFDSNNDGVWNEEYSQLFLIIRSPWWQTWWFRTISLSSLAAVILLVFYWRTHLIRKRNIELKMEVEAQTNTLRGINTELANLYAEFTESIQAAQVIQSGILPEQELLEEYFGSIKVFYKPKDVVSGDFYWCAKVGTKRLLAVIDCTGHGVAGAFMTFIAYETLNQIVRENTWKDAGQIITLLNKEILASLNRYKRGKINAGMDVSLCILEENSSQVQYAGANNPLYIVRQGNLHIYKGDKQGVGGKQKTPNFQFVTQRVNLEKGDQLYLFSDGFADQLGGLDGNTKYMYPRFRETLQLLEGFAITKRFIQLEDHFEQWRNGTEQLDDVLVIGFEIS